MTTTYRACIWTSSDKQNELVLTLECDAELNDDELLKLGRAWVAENGFAVSHGSDLGTAEAVACYPTQAHCDADADGDDVDAPRIIELSR
jgi:hypothetical protein